MQEVKIYIGTSLQGPGIKDGQYAAILEYITKNGPATMSVSGEEKDTTYYRSVLMAMVKAMERMKYPCKIHIYTNCHFIKNIYESKRVEAWKREEWKKSSGEEVANKELWQQFLELTEIHETAVRYSKHHDYRDSLRKIMSKVLSGKLEAPVPCSLFYPKLAA